MKKLVKVVLLIAALVAVTFGSMSISNNTYLDFEDSGEGQYTDVTTY